MGRPPTLTTELIAAIADHVAHGVRPLPAARACGVPERTWYEWLSRARAEPEEGDEAALLDPLYSQLSQAIDEARARFEAVMVRFAVDRARSSEDAVRILERHPETRDAWARTSSSTLTVQGTHEVVVRSPEAEADLRERLSKVLEFIADIPEPDGAAPTPEEAHDDDTRAAAR